jgi:hypothetical protein
VTLSPVIWGTYGLIKHPDETENIQRNVVVRQHIQINNKIMRRNKNVTSPASLHLSLLLGLDGPDREEENEGKNSTMTTI